MKKIIIFVAVLAFLLESCSSKSPEVSRENFATAETERYMQEFSDQGAVNKFIHEEDIAVALDKQTVIRSNIDMYYSHAVVDISKGATITLPKSENRLRIAQIIDENHYTTDVFFDEGTYKLKSNSGSNFVYVFMRTYADPADLEDQKKALEIMNSTTIESKGGKTFETKFDPEEVIEMRKEITFSATYTDSKGAFGDVGDIKDFEKFTFASAVGWGGLPEKYAVYWPIEPNLGSECATMTIDAPPVDQYWSLTVYDVEGWLAHPYPLRTSYNTTPNEDGTITFHFGCGKDALNNIEITDNWTFILRLYGPQESILNGSYKPVIPHWNNE